MCMCICRLGGFLDINNMKGGILDNLDKKGGRDICRNIYHIDPDRYLSVPAWLYLGQRSCPLP
jgi:hypothetical protein